MSVRTRHHRARRWRPLLAAPVMGAAGVALSMAPATAGDHCDNHYHVSQPSTGVGQVTGQQTSTSQVPGQVTPAVSIPQGPYDVVKHVEACNQANNGGPGVVSAVLTLVGCVMDQAVCTPAQTYMWNDTATFENGQQQTDWTRDGGGCVAPGTVVGPVITVQAVLDAAKVQAPPAMPHVEPGAQSYVNVPNNFWAGAQPSTKAVDVLGVPIQVTFEPQVVTWQFGDGESAEGNGVQDAKVGQQGAVEHAYARQGRYDITTTTSYRVTFAIPGAGPQSLTLTSAPSPAVTLPVGEIQTRVDATS